MSTEEEPARVSVVIVSDYERGEKTWCDERAAIRAFLEDEPGERMEIIVMGGSGSDGSAPLCPPDIAALSPKVVVRFEPCEGSSCLKHAALKYCQGQLIAVVDADCQPRQWLKHLVAAMEADPTLEVVSGRTVYGSDTALQRVLSLLDRGHVERRWRGRFIHISNNGALFRKHILERFPHPFASSVFVSGALHNKQLNREGVRLGVEPRAELRHAFGGLRFVLDFRCNTGFAAALANARDFPLTNRLPVLLVAVLAVARCLASNLWTVGAAGRKFLYWRDWPLLVLVLVVARLPEFVGALWVNRPERLNRLTAYR
jgi:hypothetical protein